MGKERQVEEDAKKVGTRSKNIQYCWKCGGKHHAKWAGDADTGSYKCEGCGR